MILIKDIRRRPFDSRDESRKRTFKDDVILSATIGTYLHKLGLSARVIPQKEEGE